MTFYWCSVFVFLGFLSFLRGFAMFFYYVTLNREIVLLSTGLLLIGFRNNNNILISGFFRHSVFYNDYNNTHSVRFHPVDLRLLFKSDKVHRFIYCWSYTNFCILLFICWIAATFFFKWLPYISDAVSTNTSNYHGFLQIIRWCYMAIYFLLSNGFLGALMILGFITLKNILTNQQRYYLILSFWLR